MSRTVPHVSSDTRGIHGPGSAGGAGPHSQVRTPQQEHMRLRVMEALRQQRQLDRASNGTPKTTDAAVGGLHARLPLLSLTDRPCAPVGMKRGADEAGLEPLPRDAPKAEPDPEGEGDLLDALKPSEADKRAAEERAAEEQAAAAAAAEAARNFDAAMLGQEAQTLPSSRESSSNESVHEAVHEVHGPAPYAVVFQHPTLAPRFRTEDIEGYVYNEAAVAASVAAFYARMAGSETNARTPFQELFGLAGMIVAKHEGPDPFLFHTPEAAMDAVCTALWSAMLEEWKDVPWPLHGPSSQSTQAEEESDDESLHGPSSQSTQAEEESDDESVTDAATDAHTQLATDVLRWYEGATLTTQKPMGLDAVKTDLGHWLVDMIYTRISMATKLREHRSTHQASMDEKGDSQSGDETVVDNPDYPSGVLPQEAWSQDPKLAEQNYDAYVEGLQGLSAPATYEQLVTLCLFMDRHLCDGHGARPHTSASLFGHMMLEFLQFTGTMKLEPWTVEGNYCGDDCGTSGGGTSGEGTSGDDGDGEGGKGVGCWTYRIFSGTLLVAYKGAVFDTALTVGDPQWVFEPHVATDEDAVEQRLEFRANRPGRPVHHGFIECRVCDHRLFGMNQEDDAMHVEVCPRHHSMHAQYTLHGDEYPDALRPDAKVFPFDWHRKHSLF